MANLIFIKKEPDIMITLTLTESCEFVEFLHAAHINGTLTQSRFPGATELFQQLTKMVDSALEIRNPKE